MVTATSDQTLEILHLEDSLADHELAGRTLRRSGLQCQLRQVDTLSEFQRLTDSGSFDIILADYRLPGFTALDAWAHVAQKPQHPPFILLSGAIGEAAAVDAMRLGVAEVYEVASFYHHFEVLPEGQSGPALTVRVCDGLSCEMAGAQDLLARLPALLGKDVRVIAATNRDLETEVACGRFREDLYYRIASMTLTVPPLRERSADVLPIADMLLGQACQELARPALGFSPEVRASLLAYPWPGNIRELKNEVFRAVALSEGPQVSAAAFSCRVLHGQPGTSAAAQPGLQIPGSGSLQERLDAIEAAILRETLLRHRWNKTHAAKELGLSRMGLRQKLARFGLEGQSDG